MATVHVSAASPALFSCRVLWFLICAYFYLHMANIWMNEWMNEWIVPATSCAAAMLYFVCLSYLFFSLLALSDMRAASSVNLWVISCNCRLWGTRYSSPVWLWVNCSSNSSIRPTFRTYTIWYRCWVDLVLCATVCHLVLSVTLDLSHVHRWRTSDAVQIWRHKVESREQGY